MRFAVPTVTGYPGSTGGSATVGVSAHVIDHAYNCQVLASFRSEDRESFNLGHKSIGKAEARRRAEALAARLNATVGDGGG